MTGTDIQLHIDFTGALTVKWTGKANERRPAAKLEPMFERLINTRRYLRFDFSELEHMSSSTLVVILKFFKQLKEQGVGFELRYDRAASWQCMTFAPAERIAAEPSFGLAA